VWKSFKKLNVGLLYDPEILLLGIYPPKIENRYSRKYLDASVNGSTIHNSQQAEQPKYLPVAE
jgi:hypothetical protein